jgi:hypothetical protein
MSGGLYESAGQRERMKIDARRGFQNESPCLQSGLGACLKILRADSSSSSFSSSSSILRRVQDEDDDENEEDILLQHFSNRLLLILG